MNRGVLKTLSSFLIFLSLPILVACTDRDALERVRESGQIVMLTRNNANCYYTYRDNPMGFEYDLAKAFSEYLGVELKVVTPAWERLVHALTSGRGDFIAASMSITPSREEMIDFSDEYLSIEQAETDSSPTALP